MSQYLSWHVGMKVVCVKEGPWIAVFGVDHRAPKPKYGEICTVSRIIAHHDDTFICIEGYCETDVFWAGHFRPVQTRKTDISVFKAMLTPKKKRVPA